MASNLCRKKDAAGIVYVKDLYSLCNECLERYPQELVVLTNSFQDSCEICGKFHLGSLPPFNEVLVNIRILGKNGVQIKQDVFYCAEGKGFVIRGNKVYFVQQLENGSFALGYHIGDL